MCSTVLKFLCGIPYTGGEFGEDYKVSIFYRKHLIMQAWKRLPATRGFRATWPHHVTGISENQSDQPPPHRHPPVLRLPPDRRTSTQSQTSTRCRLRRSERRARDRARGDDRRHDPVQVGFPRLAPGALDRTRSGVLGVNGWGGDGR